MHLLANTSSPFVRIARIAMIEKGIDLEPTLVDLWADDARLRAANAATRVPTLVLDDGTPLTEAMLIVQWLEATRPAPDWPSLIGPASENANLGTDHGTAGPMFLAGKPVRGGQYGDPPDLASLTVDDNLVHSTDFRRVYATLAQGWLGLQDPTAVLRGRFAPFPVFG